MTSLRTRLMAILLAATGLVWLCAVGWIYVSTQAEVERVLDARLVEAARMVNSLIGDHRIEVEAAAHEVDTAAPAFLDGDPAYSRQLSCQIWSLSGTLVGQSESAPRTPLAEGGEGFSEKVIDGETWRVFTVDNPALAVRVMVGDNLDIRQRLVNDVLLGLLLPAGLVLPLAAGLIWLSVRRGLAPLDAMAGALAARPADDLSPLRLDDAPSELRPAIGALNGLFHRVENARHRERGFTAYAAHELKTPLAGLKTQAQVALTSDDPTATRHALRQIETGVDRTARLARQLLDLARIDAADDLPSLAPIDLAALAAAIVAELSPGAARNRIAFAITGTNARARGESAFIAIALRNVIENAILHAPPGSTITVATGEKDAETSIEVTDTGPGMSEADIARATERFFRGPGTAGSGSGLGLAIVKTAMDRSRGSLTIANRPDGGLAVRLALPRA